MLARSAHPFAIEGCVHTICLPSFFGRSVRYIMYFAVGSHLSQPTTQISLMRLERIISSSQFVLAPIASRERVSYQCSHELGGAYDALQTHARDLGGLLKVLTDCEVDNAHWGSPRQGGKTYGVEARVVCPVA